MNIDAAIIKEKFQAQFGNDPAKWDKFLKFVQDGAEGIYKRPRVSVREFYNDEYYCGDLAGTIYPVVLDAVEQMCSGQYVEGVLTGGIGVSKTTAALLAQQYILYDMSCMHSPQRHFGLISSDEIVFIFQSLNANLAKSIDYERFKARIEDSKYFQEHFPFDKSKESALHFPSRIIVKPVSGKDTAAIGQNVFGGIIDEINFMAYVKESKQAADGGAYDQAQALYNSIVRRRESRFMKLGKLPGLLCLVSSKRYPGEFTDKKMEEAREQIATTGKTNIFIYDKKIWQVQPGKFSGEMFRVFVGDMTRKPRVLADDEPIKPTEKDLIEEIPVELKPAFMTDILGALRDVGGYSVLARHPLIIDQTKVGAVFGKVPSVLNLEVCDFQTSKLEISPKRFRNIDPIRFPRFAHVDLGKTGDSAGVSIGYVPEFVKCERSKGYYETLPVVEFDCVLEVPPPKGGEINFAKIRAIFFKLREQGLPIKWITYDTFQSADSIQILREANFMAGIQSVDIGLLPYTVTKTCILDGRARAPTHKTAQREFIQLAVDAKDEKVDHPQNGSKDCSDSMCGVIYGLTSQRLIWHIHKVLDKMIDLKPAKLGEEKK